MKKQKARKSGELGKGKFPFFHTLSSLPLDILNKA